MNDEQLLRYSRQIFLPNVDVEGQERLLESNILIMGVGGLGSLTAAFLAAAGVGSLTLVDDDSVEVTNLHRQLLFTQDDLGQAKVEAAKKRLLLNNPDCNIDCINERLTLEKLQKLATEVDLVLDGTDNFASRLLINQACYQAGTPLLSAAVTQFTGQLSLFDFSPDSPCYACLYPEISGDEENNCSENGILGPVAGVIASWQALYALKYLLAYEVECLHHLLLKDMLSGRNRNIALTKDSNCKICSH